MTSLGLMIGGASTVATCSNVLAVSAARRNTSTLGCGPATRSLAIPSSGGRWFTAYTQSSAGLREDWTTSSPCTLRPRGSVKPERVKRRRLSVAGSKTAMKSPLERADAFRRPSAGVHTARLSGVEHAAKMFPDGWCSTISARGVQHNGSRIFHEQARTFACGELGNGFAFGVVARLDSAAEEAERVGDGFEVQLVRRADERGEERSQREQRVRRGRHNGRGTSCSVIADAEA
jgi:hypothetical protein